MVQPGSTESQQETTNLLVAFSLNFAVAAVVVAAAAAAAVVGTALVSWVAENHNAFVLLVMFNGILLRT